MEQKPTFMETRKLFEGTFILPVLFSITLKFLTEAILVGLQEGGI